LDGWLRNEQASHPQLGSRHKPPFPGHIRTFWFSSREQSGRPHYYLEWMGANPDLTGTCRDEYRELAVSEPLESQDPLAGPEPVLTSVADGNDSVAALREQAQDIIDEVLGGTEPGGEHLRAKLRSSIARHPGFPELALLEHLMNRANNT
jgi:hypothetical protein